MAVDPIHVRMARLEGAYEQIDKRLADLRDGINARFDRVDARIDRLETRIDRLEARLETRIDRVAGRVDWMLYGVAVAILVPILLRVFFP